MPKKPKDRPTICHQKELVVTPALLPEGDDGGGYEAMLETDAYFERFHEECLTANLSPEWAEVQTRVLIENETAPSEQELDELFEASLFVARKLWREERFVELQAWANDALGVFPDEPEFWRLLAVAEGTLGNPLAAQEALLKVVTLDVTDIDAANLVAAYFHGGNAQKALVLLSWIFEISGTDARTAMLRTSIEAVRCGQIREADLPENIRISVFPSSLKNNFSSARPLLTISSAIFWIGKNARPLFNIEDVLYTFLMVIGSALT